MKTTRFLLMTFLCTLAVAVVAQTDGNIFSASATQQAPLQTVGGLPTAKGNFMIGTGIGFSTSNSKVDVSVPTGDFNGDGGSSYQLNFNPGIGYFFANNFVFGVGMDLIASRTSSQADIIDPNSAEQSSENSNLLFGPFARLYLAASDDKAFFISSTLGFGSSRDQYISAGGKTQTINNNIVTAGVGPGFTVFSNNGIALEAVVKYNFARSESNINLDNIVRNSTTRTHAFDFSVGLQYYFGGLQRINR